MRSATIIAALAATVAADTQSDIHKTLWPTLSTFGTDPPRCSTKNISQYFAPPQPAETLLTPLFYSYYQSLFQTCTSTGPERLKCPFPEQSRWCDFSTAGPSDLLSAYTSYGSLASSWWSVHSSSALELAKECENLWYNAAIIGGVV